MVGSHFGHIAKAASAAYRPRLSHVNKLMESARRSPRGIELTERPNIPDRHLLRHDHHIDYWAVTDLAVASASAARTSGAPFPAFGWGYDMFGRPFLFLTCTVSAVVTTTTATSTGAVPSSSWTRHASFCAFQAVAHQPTNWLTAGSISSITSLFLRGHHHYMNAPQIALLHELIETSIVDQVDKRQDYDVSRLDTMKTEFASEVITRVALGLLHSTTTNKSCR